MDAKHTTPCVTNQMEVQRMFIHNSTYSGVVTPGICSKLQKLLWIFNEIFNDFTMKMIYHEEQKTVVEYEK